MKKKENESGRKLVNPIQWTYKHPDRLGEQSLDQRTITPSNDFRWRWMQTRSAIAHAPKVFEFPWNQPYKSCSAVLLLAVMAVVTLVANMQDIEVCMAALWQKKEKHKISNPKNLLPKENHLWLKQTTLR
ncbi:hypothetical protein Y1Q_0011251 [Alligator mississippiensis]|uniref:Uncharacterized protein n=1 Tax=Alligator mississippiensis TaxID=8496 RepID=A0A151N834_ALLMI|nr:hypothetical protein Y1Q_0011251 [Alligator mississippiensis]